MVEFQAQADSRGEKGTSPPACPFLTTAGGKSGRSVQNSQ